MASAIKSTIAENFGGKSHELADKIDQFSLDDCPSLDGKVAVVTGGSEGIGYGAVHTFLTHQISKVFIVSMRKEVADAAYEAIESDFGEEGKKKTIWKQCDMSDLKGVAAVAQEISKETDRLDILFNNAARGIMTAQLTDYGLDRHMAVAHFGSVVLTNGLLPLLKKTASEGNTVRIVNQSSNAHEQAPKDTKFASIDELNHDDGPMGQYGKAKLAKLLHARYLARHLTAAHPKVLANATHPGFVETKMSSADILEPYPIAGYLMKYGMKPFKKDNFQGAVPAVYCATTIEESGKYICPPAIEEPGSELARNEELQDSLMKLTREVLKEKFGADFVVADF